MLAAVPRREVPHTAPTGLLSDCRIVLAHMDRLMIGRPPRSLIMTSEETLEEGIIRASIVNCPGDAYWKSVRAGWSSWLNHSEGLMEYSVTMRNAIGRLSGVLQRHAETGAELDAAALMGNLTFDVVGTTAFGVEFDTQVRLHPSGPIPCVD